MLARKTIEKAGGPAALARALQEKYYPEIPFKRMNNRVLQWNQCGIPALYAYKVAQLTGRRPEQVCPDVEC